MERNKKNEKVIPNSNIQDEADKDNTTSNSYKKFDQKYINLSLNEKIKNNVTCNNNTNILTCEEQIQKKLQLSLPY